MSSQAALAIDI